MFVIGIRLSLFVFTCWYDRSSPSIQLVLFITSKKKKKKLYARQIVKKKHFDIFDKKKSETSFINSQYLIQKTKFKSGICINLWTSHNMIDKHQSFVFILVFKINPFKRFYDFIFLGLNKFFFSCIKDF